jgi:pimeloyl-ACP methyl ester carboxylesterase
MDRVAVAGVDLEYEVRGHGEPLVLVHAGVCADFFLPLLEEHALAGQHLVLSYHRVGYAGSAHLPGEVSLADQAAHCRALMAHLEIEQAHVVGHSSGVSIALQLALDAPERVGSLALLDPARPRCRARCKSRWSGRLWSPPWRATAAATKPGR